MGLELLFDRRTLISAVNSPDLQVRPQFIRDTLFRNSRTVFTDAVDYEIEVATTKLAKFRAQGQAANVVGRTTKSIATVKLPYIREKKVLTAKELMRENSLGNVYINGAADINAARQRVLATELQDLKNRILRRVEWMCCTQLVTGKLQYEDESVAWKLDLGVPSAFKPVLSGSSLWSASGTADIMGNLDSWNVLINQATGLNASRALLGTNAARSFLKDPTVQKHLDTNNYKVGAIAVDVTSNYLGRLYGIDFWRYSHQYTDDAGNPAEMFPSNMCVLIAGDFETELLYGVVEEEDQTFAGEFFSKSWIEQDPSVRWLLVASRPLPVIKRLGSWVMATVV